MSESRCTYVVVNGARVHDDKACWWCLYQWRVVGSRFPLIGGRYRG